MSPGRSAVSVAKREQRISPNRNRADEPDDRDRVCFPHFGIKHLRAPAGGAWMAWSADSSSHSASSRSRQSGLNRPERDAVGGALGITAKSVRHSGDRARRFRWQRHAAKLLGGQGRVGLCRWSVVSKQKGVDVVETLYASTGEVRAHFEGVQTCGSVWSCPCCGARISETRRGELNHLLAWARGQGLAVSMITLTARHGRDDDLAALLDSMKNAKQRWARHRSYAAIKPDIIGSVTATEVTGGGVHGWHPHFHVIVVTRHGVDLAPLGAAWLASLRGAGLEGAGAAFQVQDASAAGAYVAKWGAAEEVTMGARKVGRSGGGRTPAQLLAASCDEGDELAGHLWRQFSDVFRGRRQLVWSRGLKGLAGVGEITDEDAARDERQDDQQEVSRGNIPHPSWCGNVASHRVDRRAALLGRAEAVGAAQAAAEAQGEWDASAQDDEAEVIESGVHVSDGNRAPSFGRIGKSDQEASASRACKAEGASDADHRAYRSMAWPEGQAQGEVELTTHGALADFPR